MDSVEDPITLVRMKLTKPIIHGGDMILYGVANEEGFQEFDDKLQNVITKAVKAC